MSDQPDTVVVPREPTEAMVDAAVSLTGDGRGITKKAYRAMISQAPAAGGGEVERVFIDCEFDGHGGQLLSMALVAADDRALYLCIPDRPESLSPWVAQNVWPLVHKPLPVGRTVAFLHDWGSLIKAWLGEGNATITADSPVDIGRFCTVLSTGIDGGWASTDFPRLRFEVVNVDCYPTDVPDAIQHNAYWDAVALRRVLS